MGPFRDIPAKSRDIPPKKFDFPGFEGHTELFGPHPFAWKTPTPPENIRTQSLGLCSFFPEFSASPRKRPVLLWADFVPSKDPWPLYYKTPVFFTTKKIALCEAFWVLRRNQSLVKRAISLVRLKVWGWGLFSSFNMLFKKRACCGGPIFILSHPPTLKTPS